MRRPHPSTLRLASLSAFLLLGHSAHAAAYDWTAASGSTWATGWTSGNVPGTGDDLTIFGPFNSAGVLNIDVAATAAAKTVNITDTSAVTLTNINSGSDKTLTIQSGLTTGSGAVTIGSTTANQGVLVALGAAQTWNIGSGGLTLNNSYSGTGTLTKTGSGTLTFNAANASTGTLAISGGTVVANGDTAGVFVSTKALSFGGGSFIYRSTNASANAQTLGAINVNAGSNTLTSEETGAGSSTLTIGTITRTAGATVNLVTSASGGGTAVINSTPALSLNRGIFYNGDYATSAGAGAISAVNYGVTANTFNVSGAMTATANAYYNLTGASTANNLNLQGGTIKFGGNFTLGVTNPLSVAGFLTNGATAAVISGSGSVRQNGEIVFATNGSNDQLTVSAVVAQFNNTSNGQVTKAGAGQLVFSGANTYLGTTFVNQGTLKSTSANGLGSGSMGAINLGTGNKTIVAAGATLDLAPATAMTVNEVITLTNAALTNSGSGTTTIDNGIAAINLTNLGSGISAGATASFSGGGGTGAAGTVSFGLTTASIDSVSGGTGFAVGDVYNVTGGGGGSATITVTSVSSGAITGATVNSAGSGYTGAPTGIGTKVSGTGNGTGGSLTGNATGFTLASFNLSNAGSGYTSAPGVNLTSGTTAATAILSSLTLTGTANTIGGAGNFIINAVVADGTSSGGFSKIGAGIVTFNGTNTFTGGTTVTTGTLATGSTGTFGAGDVSVAAGASLTFGNNASIGDLKTLTFASTSNISLGFTGSETVGAVFNSVTSSFLTAGTYDATSLNGFFGGISAFSGSGSLTVSAVPEPATYAALAGAAILGFATLRRRRLRA